MTTTRKQVATAKNSITVAGKVVYLSNKELLAEIIRSKEAGHMSNALAMMLQLLCSRYAKKGNFINYCVDEQSQALTPGGWVYHHELTVNDQLLSYDIHTKQLKWSNVLGIYSNQYDGLMHALTTEGMDALVTPNHKFVSVERGIIPVEDIISAEHLTLMGSGVDDGSGCYTDAFVRLIGWAVTEGHYSTKSKVRHSIRISQKTGTKADQIRECINLCEVKYKEYLQNDIISFHCTGSEITNIHNNIAPNRVLSSDFILSLTQKQRMLLIDTMVAGDGWTRPSGGKAYFQKCGDHIDAFLMLCTIAGQTTHAAKTKSTTPASGIKPGGGICEGTTVTLYAAPKLQCRAEHIDFHGGKQSPGGVRVNKPNLPTESYSGIIWCPQTMYGTFVCRRNGYIYVTGNSYNEDMQAYALMMLVRTWNSFNPEKSNNPFAFFTQCIKNSFIQYLNQEKRQRDVRDVMLIDQGMNPSYGFGDGTSQSGVAFEDEQNLDIDNFSIDLIAPTVAEEVPIERDDRGEELPNNND